MWTAVLTVHLLAMAFFVGGQLLLAVAVVPVELRTGDRERIRAIARRFGWGSLVALVVLAASGAALAGHKHRWSDGTLQAKLGLVAVLIALVIAHLRRPRSHVLDAAILVVSIAVVVLGVSLASP